MLSSNTRATNEAIASPGQAINTYEGFASAADPVNALSGEMTLQLPLVKVAGCGLDFSFVLTYRSGFSYDGPVGDRWEHNWNARFKYSTLGGATKLTRYADNRVEVYNHGSGQVYTSPTGYAHELLITKFNDGTLNRVERRLRDGTLEVYKELDSINEVDWYFLAEIQHRDSDNKISLTYDTTEKLATITDTRGKDVLITYDSNKRISTIEDWSSGARDRDWVLSYQSGDLTRVDAEGRLTELRYTGDSLLESITAPREAASGGISYLFNTYDTETLPRVVSQRLGATGQTFSLSYATTACTV